MIKKIGGLLLARVVTLVLLLLFNFFLVKDLAVDEVGFYYLIATISYLGNAVVFVGADLMLQKHIASDVQSGNINKKALVEYLLKTSLLGSGIVFVFSMFIFSFLDVSFVHGVVVCTLLTTTTYITTLLRNLYQTAAKPYISSFIQLADTAIKLLTVILCVWLEKSTALFLLLSYLVLSVALLCILFGYVLKTHRNTESHRYFGSYALLGKEIFPIGSAGVLNWVQLQSYRPFLSIAQQNFAALGAISFLTNLGSTATNATMTVLSQLYLPRVYASKGIVSKQYLVVIAALGAGLAVISLPCGWLFLSLANKQEMLATLYLIPVGVLQETINSMIGAMTVHYTVKSQRLSIFPICTMAGVVFMLAMLLMLQLLNLPLMAMIALSLLCSQLLVISSLLLQSIKRKVFSHAES